MERISVFFKKGYFCMENKKKSQADIDWKNRVLCSDGNCIGVIGTDGRCKECGLLFDGDLPAAPSGEDIEPETTHTEPAQPAARREEVEEAENPEAESAPATDGEWENRRLCSDGNCIGVIGPDGKCKECGLAYKR
jgi:rubredoxin